MLFVHKIIALLIFHYENVNYLKEVNLSINFNGWPKEKYI